LLFFVLYLLFSVSAKAQTTVSDYRPGVTTDGAVYFLPRTALRITVLVERTTYEPGDYASYAQRYLRLQNVSLDSRVNHRVVSIKQSSFGMADKQKAYAVKFNAKTVAANVALADDGRLLAINAEPTAEVQPTSFTPAPKATPLNPRQFLNGEILSAGSTAKMAELISREICDLRENHSLLIKGQADFMPKDGQQMKLMLTQLETQEQALRSLFEGTTTCDTTEYILTFVPEKPVSREVLFRLSPEQGMVDADDLSGEPFYISIENISELPPVDQEAAAKVKKKVYESGVYVNVPGRMRSTIHQGIDQINQAEFPVAQFGNVELLSAELFDKRYTTQLWISPLTGAVERLQADMKK
jgi:hypothetical protein